MQDIKAFEPLWGEWCSSELLGQGSFGKVYKMVKKDLDKEYYAAVKHLSLPNEPGEEKNLYAEGIVTDNETLKIYYDDVLKTLRSEIDLCYKLKGYTNIVSYEDHYIRPKDTGVGYDIFIKMELLTGLQDRIKEGGLTVPDVVKLGEDICKALTVLRREKIVHRDIKPGNIFVNSGGDYKLGDFGVSRTLERTISSMSVKGTFSYMAPEVAKGSAGDYRVDIYSLGLVLYRMLNKNRGPFLPLPPQKVTHELSMITQERRLQGEPLPPPADADEELSQIILKACAYRSEDRWDSANEMGKALARYRLGVERAALATPPPPPVPPVVDNDEDRTEYVPPPDPPKEPPPKEEAAPVPESVLPRPKKKPAFFPIVSKKVKDIMGLEQKIGADTPAEPYDDPTELISAQPVESELEETVLLTTGILSEDNIGGEAVPEEQKPTEEDAPQTNDTGRVSIAAASAHIKAKLAGIKAKPQVIAGGVAAVVLIGVISVAALAGGPSASAETASIPSEPTVSITTPPPGTDSPEQILWQDPFIRDGVLSTLGIDEEDLTLELLAELEELRLSVAALDPEPISTLADLSMLTGLKTLELSGHPIEKFDFPENMASLETLKIARCGCDSVEFLAQPCFKGLRELDLSGNAIINLSSLSGLSSLASLNISQTSVTSLEPLSGLTNLTVLSAVGIPAEDWSFVERIANVNGRPEPTAEPVETEVPDPDPTLKPAPTQAPRPTRRPATATPTQPPQPATIPVSAVLVSPSEMLLGEGGGVRLSASISPANATNQRVSWSSSNPSVAVVDGSGYVSAVGRGTARIIATCGGQSGFCTITVD